MLNIREISPIIRGVCQCGAIYSFWLQSPHQGAIPRGTEEHLKEAAHLPCLHSVAWAILHAWNSTPCLPDHLDLTPCSRFLLWEASTTLQLSVLSPSTHGLLLSSNSLPLLAAHPSLFHSHSWYVCSSSGQRQTNSPFTEAKGEGEETCPECCRRLNGTRKSPSS